MLYLQFLEQYSQVPLFMMDTPLWHKQTHKGPSLNFETAIANEDSPVPITSFYFISLCFLIFF